MALLFGGLLVFIVPPFQSPDEYNHFFRAFQVSEGHFYPETLQGNRLGGGLPVSLDSFKNVFLPLKGDYGSQTSLAEMREVLSLPLEPGQQQFTDFPNTAIYAPTGYFTQALGIVFARYFTDRVLLLFYAARLFNLLCWIALAWAALRAMPFQKQTLAFLALMPASLAIAASCNADVLTNGLAFYAVAVFCRGATLHYGEGRHAAKGAVGAVVLTALNKLVFVPLALLSGLSGFARQGEWKTSLRRAIIPLLLSLAAAVWWGAKAQQWFIPYDRYDPEVRDLQTLNPGVNPPEQIRYILSHPLSFMETVAVSALRAAPSAAAHVVGKFGWEKNYLPAWMLALLWLALIAQVFSEKNLLKPAQRAWIAGIVLLCMALWVVTMYTLWCPVGAADMDNWQGRYFVPLGPLAALVVGVGWGQRWEKWSTGYAVLILAAGGGMLIYSVLGRYWL